MKHKLTWKSNFNLAMTAFAPNRRAEQIGLLKSKEDNGAWQIPFWRHQSSARRVLFGQQSSAGSVLLWRHQFSSGRVQFWHQSSTGSVLFDDTSPVLGVSCFDDTSPESIGTHPLTCLWITSQVFCYESQLSHVGGPRCTVRTISSSCAAGLGALYGPLVLHVLLASVHCTVVNAFRIIVTSNPFRLG